LVASAFQGHRCVLVSSRAGRKELLLFAFEDDLVHPRRYIVEEGAGAANLVVVTDGQRDLILAANQGTSEIVLYTPRE
ncbi:MAG TPA: hypothetical protein VMK12_02065, partial [Anaeromyxobacteraceae bacterium]|nr:hypothetical protein [Anaeromyxobacteraceae bacterium]